jgi:DNA polymerase III subunit epsilon
MYLFFDTETNGLPKDWKAPSDDFDNWPRVIQLAYAIYDESEKLIHKSCSLIKPDGWEIPAQKFWIDNGYSTERSITEGVPFEPVLNSFVQYRSVAKYSIAHNMAFDGKILRAEMIRHGINTEFTSKKICTMTSSTDFCKLPSTRGYKWPRLEELHRILFGCDFEGAHDALNDVMATAKCFFELKKRNVISL